jgi:predicted SnoaL-like aldol condensation-catalyzing enzyme
MTMALPTTRRLSRRNAVRLASVAMTTGVVMRTSSAVAAQTATEVMANTALVRRFFAEAVNHGQTDLVDKVYALTFVDRSAKDSHLAGRDSITQWITDLHTQFPGIQATVEDTIAEGDRVAARVTWRGSHPPKGTHLVGMTLHLFRLSDDHIVEAWSAGWE